jgi:hypothetical protein
MIARLPRLPEPLLRVLLDCATGADLEHEAVDEATFFGRSLLELWTANRHQLLAAWVEEHPGTRPSLWWRCDAPRQPLGIWPEACWDGQLEQPRERLCGIGMAAWEALAYVPCYHLGIPAYWLTERDVLLYSGKATDVHGRPIMPEFAKRPFRGVAVDANDPPRFEAQCRYLSRHGLLTRGEARRLQSADFEAIEVL